MILTHFDAFGKQAHNYCGFTPHLRKTPNHFEQRKWNLKPKCHFSVMVGKIIISFGYCIYIYEMS